MTEPKPQEIYRHFKGRYYQVITMATKEDTEERLVIYQALYGNYGVYARSLSSFTERLDPARYASQNVTGQTFRFEKADPDALRETPPRTGRAQEKAEDGGAQRERVRGPPLLKQTGKLLPHHRHLPRMPLVRAAYCSPTPMHG